MRTFFILSLIFFLPAFLNAQTDPNKIDFEPGNGYAPVDQQPVNNNYFDANYGVTFHLGSVSGPAPVMAKVGAPSTAFTGFLPASAPFYDGCPGINNQTQDDMPRPGENAGCWFLTDDLAIAPQPDPLYVVYSTDCSVAGGVLYDIDGNERWTIEAHVINQIAPEVTIHLCADGNGGFGPCDNEVGGIYQDVGDGIGTEWSVDVGNKILDFIKVSHTGTQTGNVGLAFDCFTFCSAPCDNVVMHFDGDGDFIQAANSPVQGSGDFTIEAWFLNQDDDGNGNTCSGNFERIIGCGGDRFEIGTCGTNLATVINSASATIPVTTILNDQWYHVAATRSGNEVKIYLDCVEVYSTTNNFTLNNTFRVGRWAGGSAGDNELWKGLVDEVRAWNYARTPAEIEAGKNCELTGSEPGLQLYYNFEEGIPEGNNTGLTAAADVSPNGNDGTLNGFALTGNASNYVCDNLPLCDACFANFSYESEGICGEYLFFNGSSGDGLSYCWDFDNNPGTCESSDVNPAYTFPASGTYNVCLTVSNASGCEKTYCEEIAVNFADNPPTIDCPPNQTIQCDELPGNITPDVSNSVCATFLDVVCTRSDGLALTDPFPPCDDVTITCGATNDFGGTICQFTVTTQDATPPMAVCVANLTVMMEDCMATITPDDVDDMSFDNCGIVSKSLDIDQFGPADACQFVDVTLTVTDCGGNTDQCVTTVFLQDNTVVNLTCPPNVQVDCDTDPAITGYPTGDDPCPGPLNYDYLDDTLGLMPCDAIVTRTWIVSDACGNMATCEQSILVVDQTPPDITCPPDVTVVAPNAADPILTGQATATDNCDPDPTVNFSDVLSGSEPCPKTITRTWTAEDQCFQIDQCVQVISVDCDSVNVCAGCQSGVPAGPNLVPNGDFENGNVQANFNFTSDYGYIPTALVDDGQYSVRNSTTLVNPAWSCLDHTAGMTLGWFLVCDGSTNPGDFCYRDTVAVTPGTEYIFCAFANNLVDPGDNLNVPNVEVYINGSLVTSATLPESPDVWQVLTSPWTATTTTAIIEIRSSSSEPTGNDFAIDDISLAACEPLDPCCTDFEAFCDHVNAGFSWSIDPDSCKLTVHLNDFTDCMEVIDWIWDDGTSGGVPNPDDSYCHFYDEGGTYTICYLAVERNASGDICWEKEYCETISFECTDTCALDTFFIRTGYDYANDQPLVGNNVPNPYWTISGQPMVTTSNAAYQTLPGTRYVRAATNRNYTNWNADFSFCLPDNQFDCTELTMVLNVRVDNRVNGVMLNGNPLLTNWTATQNNFGSANPYTFTWTPTALECGYFKNGTNVLTFTFRNYGGPSGLDVSGYITFNPASTSTAFDIDCCAPAPVCPCASLQANADLGILGPKMAGYQCYGSFRPAGLTECDSVSWTVDGTYVGSTHGTFEYQGANLQTSLSTEICMEVFRTQPNGVTCGPVTVCKTISVNCNPPVEDYPAYPECTTDFIGNPGFDEGTEEGPLSEIGDFGGWEVAFGEPYVKNEPGFGDNGYLLLSGDANESDGVMQKLNLTPGKEYTILMGLNFGDWNISQDNTRVVVRLSDNEQIGTMNEGDVEEMEIACCIGDTIPIIAILIPENWDEEVYLTVHVENDQGMPGDGGSSKSILAMDNACIVDEVSAVGQLGAGRSARLFPNPTTGKLNLLLDRPTTGQLRLTVSDPQGRHLSESVLPEGQTLHTLELHDLPPAMYLLTVTDEAGNTWHSKFVKQ